MILKPPFPSPLVAMAIGLRRHVKANTTSVGEQLAVAEVVLAGFLVDAERMAPGALDQFLAAMNQHVRDLVATPPLDRQPH